MKPRSVEPLGSPNPAFDVYRRRVARAFEDGAHIGYLATRIGTWWRQEGPFWARRLLDPEELPEWFLSFTVAPTEERWYEDWVAMDTADGARVLEGWERGYVEVNGHRYDLEWLDTAAPDVEAQFDWYWKD